MHADSVAAHNPVDIAEGVIECKASAIRELVDSSGVRSVCLFDDPVIGHEGVPDNPALATLIATRDVEEVEMAEIRTRLSLAFSPVRKFEM